MKIRIVKSMPNGEEVLRLIKLNSPNLVKDSKDISD